MSIESYFGEQASLQAICAEAKNMRRARNPAHVLIVEDDPITSRLVSYAFKETFATISARDAHEAVVHYLSHAPDIVFLDIGLPDVDGFLVLEQILTMDKEAFVVMFSSHNDPDTVIKSIKGGAKGFVPKPFKKEVLARYIQESAIHHHKLSIH